MWVLFFSFSINARTHTYTQTTTDDKRRIKETALCVFLFVCMNEHARDRGMGDNDHQAGQMRFWTNDVC
jgi:hypothetical protein